MKHTAEDFKDILAGELDKPAAVNRIIAWLDANDMTCKIVRRRTAAGRKIYFNIINRIEELDQVQGQRDRAQHIIKLTFPNAHLTSAGSITWTIAEF